MEFEILEQDSSIKLIRLNGSLAGQYTEQFKKLIDTIISNKEGLKECVIDVSRLSFIDSSGIGALIYQYMHLKQEGIMSVIITGTDPDSYINNLFKSTQLHKVLTFITSLGSGIKPNNTDTIVK